MEFECTISIHPPSSLPPPTRQLLLLVLLHIGWGRRTDYIEGELTFRIRQCVCIRFCAPQQRTQRLLRLRPNCDLRFQYFGEQKLELGKQSGCFNTSAYILAVLCSLYQKGRLILWVSLISKMCMKKFFLLFPFVWSQHKVTRSQEHLVLPET